MKIQRGSVVALLLFLLNVSPVFATEPGLTDQSESLDALIVTKEFSDQPVAIGNVLSSPESYQLHFVTLAGRVLELRPIGSHLPQCGPIYDSYSLTIEDGTGAVEVFVGSACHKPELRIQISKGDRVSIQALLQAIITEPKSIVAVAKSIRRFTD